MSFLLRKPRGVPATRVPPSGGHRNAASEGKSAAWTQSAQSSSRSAGGGQVQQLLQRRPAQQTHKTMQSGIQKTQQVSAGTQKELQGVISMEEVMEDLRVLEQQQLESQRKLAAIKLTKQHKLEQRSTLESKLSSLKYANGEQRAQLVRARDVLSRCTRELGAAKLRSGRSSEALKAFDGRLKRALLSVRSLQVGRRKLDSEIVVLRNKESIILRLKSQVMDSLKAAEKRRDDAKHREQCLRKAIHDESLNAKCLIEQTTTIRSDISGLEQDLAAAEHMASLTKLRADTIIADSDAEDRRHDNEMQAILSKIEACKKKEADRAEQTKAMKKQIELKKARILEAWKRCVQNQQEEGHELCPEPSDDGPAPSIDVKKLRAKLEEEQEALRVEKESYESWAESIKQYHEELANLASGEAASKKEAASICKAAEEAQKVENDRRETGEKFLANLEKERREVYDLRRSVSELEEFNGREKKRLENKFSEQAHAIEKCQVDLEEVKARLAAAGTTIHELEGSIEKAKKENAQAVEAAKQEADIMRASFEDVRREVETLENASDADIQKEVDDIQQAQIILVEDTKDEIARLCEEYPALADIEFTFDPERTLEEHAKEALFDLRADCDAQIEQARAQKEAAMEKEQAERKAQKRAQEREAEQARAQKEAAMEKEQAERKAQKKAQEREAEALRRRRKEERRKGRLREMAEDDTTSLNEATEEWQDFDNYSVSEAEEEPLAVSQKRIRFEDDEVPSQVAKEVNDPRIRTEKRTYGRMRTYGSRESSVGSMKSKSKKDDRKESASSRKRSGRSRSASIDGTSDRVRHESSKSLTKCSTSSESTSKPKSRLSAPETRPTKSPKLENSNSWTSKESSSRSASRSPVPENRPSKRLKHMDIDASRSSKSQTSQKNDFEPTKPETRPTKSPKLESSKSWTSKESASRSASRSPVPENRPSKRLKHMDIDASRSSKSRTSQKSDFEPTRGFPMPETRPAKSPKRVDMNSVTTLHFSLSKSDRGVTSKSQAPAKGSGFSKKDVRWENSRDTLDKKSLAPSCSSTKSSDRESRKPKREDDRSIVSQKSSSNRSIATQKTQKTSNKGMSSSREAQIASQASGISTMERATKSRRRKKPMTGKAKTTSLSSLGALQDDDFRF